MARTYIAAFLLLITLAGAFFVLLSADAKSSADTAGYR